MSLVVFLTKPVFQLRPFGACSPCRWVRTNLLPSARRQPVSVTDVVAFGLAAVLAGPAAPGRADDAMTMAHIAATHAPVMVRAMRSLQAGVVCSVFRRDVPPRLGPSARGDAEACTCV